MWILNVLCLLIVVVQGAQGFFDKVNPFKKPTKDKEEKNEK